MSFHYLTLRYQSFKIPRHDRELVFGIRKGGYSGWDKSKCGLDKAVQFKTAWTLHDLRRTVRTGLGMLGVLPHVAEADAKPSAVEADPDL